jgi:hypothetical protein
VAARLPRCHVAAYAASPGAVKHARNLSLPQLVLLPAMAAPARLVALCAACLLAGALPAAAAPSAPPLGLLKNASLWGRVLGEPGWWGALQREVVTPLGGASALPPREPVLAPLANFKDAQGWALQECRRGWRRAVSVCAGGRSAA